jgi:hypothetical protein
MFFLRVWINLLARGNPFAIAVTAIGAVAISVGPFYEGLKSGDPAAIWLVALIFAGIVLILVVGIIDKKLNPDPKMKQPTKRAGSRTAGSGKR